MAENLPKAAVKDSAGLADPGVNSEGSRTPPNNEVVDTVTSEKTESARDVHGLKWFLVVCSVLSSTFLFGLDTTIVATIQPAIVNEFDALAELPWLFTAFMLGAAATNLIWGQAYSQLNTKWLYISCIFVFEVGSAVSGSAQNMDAMIVGRAICGMGGAGMYTGVMTFLSISTTEKERALYLGIPGLTWGAATVLGPIFGGLFEASNAGWRFAFYINLFIGALFAPVTIFMIPSMDPRPGTSAMDRFRELDWIGLVLMSGIYVSGLMAISFGGVEYPWNSGRTIALFVVSGALIIIYWLQQAFCIGTTKERRTIPFEFLKNTRLMCVFMIETCSSAITFVSVSFLPLYFQLVRGDDALQSGVRLLPFVAFLVFFQLFAGFMVSKYLNLTPAIFVFGGVLSLIGGVLLYNVDENTSPALIYGYTILLGSGAGAYLQLPFAAAQSYIEPRWIPVAVGFISYAQLASPAITVAISNAIFLNLALKDVSAFLPQANAHDVSGIISGIDRQFLGTVSEQVRGMVIHAIVQAMRNVYILVFVAASLSLILVVATLVPKRSMSRKSQA